MATYPNNYRTGAGFNPNYSYYGNMPLFSYNAELGTGAGSRLNWMISETGGFARTSSAPDGYGMKTPFPPVKAGAMSAYNDPVVQLSMTGNMLQGGPMEGSASVLDFTTVSGGLSLVVGLAGTAAVVSLTGNGMVLRLTVGLDGSGSWSLTGTPNLAMIVPFEGAGSVCSMTGLSDLKGRLSLAGEWTPFTELSPEGLAAAVWNSLLSQYQEDGTAGKALSLASSGGVDLNALAQAVLAALKADPSTLTVPKFLGLK